MGSSGSTLRGGVEAGGKGPVIVPIGRYSQWLALSLQLMLSLGRQLSHGFAGSERRHGLGIPLALKLALTLAKVLFGG